jgi:serine/threonine-protein kinase
VRLTVETGPLAGTVVHLDRGQPTLLGSSEECSLRVQEPGVPAQQAVVKALREEGFGVKALAPGLRLNGAAIEASPLRDGDVLEIGTTRIAFGKVQDQNLPRIPGYRLSEELGRGGMGMVYRAEQVSLHREVALKVLNRELTQDPVFVAKFVAEARAAAKLQHPNVVQVFDVDHDGETYFITMELMHDGSLESWLKQHGAMPVDRALRVVADAAAGLAYAESLGIVHRDIKPDNLMLDRHGAVKIADLGLARSADDHDTKAVGTPHFMAPEQVLRKEIDHRTDLYALGCTFYRLVTGRTPFRGQTVKDILRAQVKDEAEPAHKVNSDVAPEISAIIARLMEKEPSDRFQTANDLLEELDLLLAPKAKKGLWIGLAAVGVLVAGGAIWWAVTRAPEIVEVTRKYDDPEKQEFADRLVEQDKMLREKDATIALLTARVSGLTERELAAAFDRVAADNPGTKAAVEAGERAEALRRQLADRERLDEQRQAMVADHIAKLRQDSAPALADGDFARALAVIDRPAAESVRDAPEFPPARSALREEVVGAARTHLQTLDAAIAAARSSKDEAAIATACDAVDKALAGQARWPAELAQSLAETKANCAAARTEQQALGAARTALAWKGYSARFTVEGGIGDLLRRQDFAGAAAAADDVAQQGTEPVVVARAKMFATVARQAASFTDVLERAIAEKKPVLASGDNTALPIVRWQRAERTFVLLDESKRQPAETSLSTASLGYDTWAALTDNVTDAPAGSRECFLGLMAVVAHADAARNFLGRLRADDDQSGTGADSYPLGATTFEQLLRRLPADANDASPWVPALRAELQAGLRLAAGLRAFSERRNLAAASHIERLLAEHPHSGVVALLP